MTEKGCAMSKKNKNEVHDYNAKNEQRKASKFENTLLISGIILLVIIIIIILLLTKCGRALKSPGFDEANDPKTSSNVDVQIDPDSRPASGDVDEENQGRIQSGKISIPGYGEITLVADSTDARIQLLNPSGNPCYFQFTIGLLANNDNEMSEVLYTSKYVEPGSEIRQQTLARGLPAGNYDALIKIQTLSIETKTPMNSANIRVALNVK
jgi:hypothetical protein